MPLGKALTCSCGRYTLSYLRGRYIVPPETKRDGNKHPPLGLGGLSSSFEHKKGGGVDNYFRKNVLNPSRERVQDLRRGRFLSQLNP